MPDGMRWLFSYYEDAIVYAREHPQEINSSAWESDFYSRETVYLSRLGDVEWGQNGNNDNYDYSCEKIYNKFCPEFHNVSCGRTIVGCGAVALGQVLWYYQWPHWGFIPMEMLNDSGVTSTNQEFKIYDWNLMPGQIFPSTPIEEVDMIASFLRDCGYAECMEYGSGGSNTYVHKIANALMNNFGYSSVQYLSRSANPINWVNRMKNEIRAGRPVIYRGGNNSTGEGHFFVLYGFQDDHFNINWGWKGRFNHTLFKLDSLYVYNTHYNDGHWAITNISPSYPSCDPIVVPPSAGSHTNFVFQNGGPISIGNRTITSNMQGVIFSQESVTLTSGFKIEAGAHVYIDIKDMHCDDRTNDPDSNEDTPDIFHAPQTLTANTNNPPAATKILRDGHILIIRDNRTYTLTGQPVE